MTQVHYGRLDPDTPLVFADGTAIYAEFGKEYKVHKKGFFIMAPSGAGKTYFVNQQKEKDWIDGDQLWEATGAAPKGEWWLAGDQAINEVDQRSDAITVQAKKLGFWVIGASNYWLVPDASVLPDWETHKRYIEFREKNNYDGGATSDRLDQVLGHRKWIEKWAKQNNVPIFPSVQEAADYLSSSVK